MEKKYFTGFCNMNSRDLHSNALHHSCLVLFEADCDKNEKLTSPLRVVDSYGFYSHPAPAHPSFFKDPVTFLSVKAGISFRLRGSYGVWRREDIHNLALGRGLTGRLFEMNESQFALLRKNIGEKVATQKSFLTAGSDIQANEEHYQAEIHRLTAVYIKEGLSKTEAKRKAKEHAPLSEFRFSLRENAYTCKVAALEMLASSYDASYQSIHHYIDVLKGILPAKSVPRLTIDLDDVVIHVNSPLWEPRGRTSKFPYIDWENALTDKNFSMFVVDFGGRYVNLEGHFSYVSPHSAATQKITHDLKVISRVCEIYLRDANHQAWYQEISHHLENIAAMTGEKQQTIAANHAHDYLSQLVNNDLFKNKMKDSVPENLAQITQSVMDYYDTGNKMSMSRAS